MPDADPFRDLAALSRTHRDKFMTQLRSEDILASVNAFNDAELVRRRDYYAYLCENEPQTESFEQHLERYADLARSGKTATADELSELAARIAIAIPDELQEFYLSIGSLRCGAAQLFALPELLGCFHGVPTAYGVANSLGIIDMIRLCWGNDRFEFDPVQGYIKQAEIDMLNAAYACIGWYMPENEESSRYIYFDEQGKFGTLFYHQDGFDELYADYLLPMLSVSPATQTLSEIILDIMRVAASRYNDDREDADA